MPAAFAVSFQPAALNVWCASAHHADHFERRGLNQKRSGFAEGFLARWAD
jgi:hypothetical protein